MVFEIMKNLAMYKNISERQALTRDACVPTLLLFPTSQDPLLIVIQTRKRPANFSPQVPPTAASMIPNNTDLDADLHEYSLDHSHQPAMLHQLNTHPGVPFQLDPYNMEHDPILTSAGPFQQGFSFSPSESPLVSHGPFSNMYNNA